MITETGETPTLGAVVLEDGVRFRVWAPATNEVELVLDSTDDAGAAPSKTYVLEPEGGGYHSLLLADAREGDRYRYRLDGSAPFPDPASRYQPEGVHGPSEIVDGASYRWRHDAPVIPQAETVIYELHVGTFTPAGTFASAAERLPYLVELGVNTIELMPLGDFPGRWNWGYDPGAFFAPSRAYGTPDELRALIDEAHRLGLRVILDVVYNHFGPDGAYLPAFSPSTFTERHKTPWGPAINFDGDGSEGVRRFCLENALMWLREYRFDGLRLDATFAIVDDRPRHLLSELAAAAAALPGPSRLLIAEDPRNLRNLVLPESSGGIGLSAVWADDFHHQIRVRLTGEDQGYYQDFTGNSADIWRTVQGNWFYTGHHSPNLGVPRGTPAADLAPEHFVYCIQNHDQIGNRPEGDRLNTSVELNEYRAVSALLLFLPQLPMLFMGQEWAASTPFLFFTDHQGELGAAVSEGRREEFAAFAFGADVPDPQDPDTFRRSLLDWEEAEREPHAGILRLYRDLLKLRRDLAGTPIPMAIAPGGLMLRRHDRLLVLALEEDVSFELPAGAQILWSSEDSRYSEKGTPPRVEDGFVRFPRAAALLAQLPRDAESTGTAIGPEELAR